MLMFLSFGASHVPGIGGLEIETTTLTLIGKEEHFRNTEMNVCNLIREDVSNHYNNGDATK